MLNFGTLRLSLWNDACSVIQDIFWDVDTAGQLEVSADDDRKVLDACHILELNTAPVMAEQSWPGELA